MAGREARHCLHEDRARHLVDGDFWHGWKFDQWSEKLAPYWRDKIAGNRARDRRHMARLRREGWTVLRVWEHDVKKHFERCIERIEQKVAQLRET